MTLERFYEEDIIRKLKENGEIEKFISLISQHLIFNGDIQDPRFELVGLDKKENDYLLSLLYTFWEED